MRKYKRFLNMYTRIIFCLKEMLTKVGLQFLFKKCTQKKLMLLSCVKQPCVHNLIFTDFL